MRAKPGPDPEELAELARQEDAQTLANACPHSPEALKARLFFEHIACARDSHDELRRAQDLACAGFPLCANDETLGVPPFHFLAQNGSCLCWDWLTGLELDWDMPDASGLTLARKLAASLNDRRAERLAWLYSNGHARLRPLLAEILDSANPEAPFILETHPRLRPILRDPAQWGTGDARTRLIAKAWIRGLAIAPESGMRSIRDSSEAEQTISGALCLCAHADSPSGMQACLNYAKAYGIRPGTEGAFAIAWHKQRPQCLEILAPETSKSAQPGFALQLLCAAGASLQNPCASKCIACLGSFAFPEAETSTALRRLLSFSHAWDDLQEHLCSLDWAQALQNSNSLSRAWSRTLQHSGLPSSTAFMSLSRHPAIVSALERTLFSDALPGTKKTKQLSRSL